MFNIFATMEKDDFLFSYITNKLECMYPTNLNKLRLCNDKRK